MSDVAFLRRANEGDLDILIAFSEQAGAGITSLPRNLKFLAEKLSPDAGGDLFCLEWKDEVIGTSGIVRRVGTEIPFSAYQLRHEEQHSAYLGIDRQLTSLHMIQDRRKPTEIGTLYLKKALRGHAFGRLLSLGRFLYIANFRSQFAPTVIAELRGVNQEGRSPFYEAIGRHFFEIDFSEADYLRTAHPECIQELFPTYPIYKRLLSKSAQHVIGQPHAHTMPAKQLLMKQGFQVSDFCDILDAGPHLFAQTDQIHAIAESQLIALGKIDEPIKGGQPHLIANTREDFRASIALVSFENDVLTLSADVAQALNVDKGETLRIYRGHL